MKVQGLDGGRSSLTQLRERNLAQVAEVLYRKQSLTLAELTRLVDLKRPTVAVLLGQLTEAGLARENGIDQATGGRHARTFEIAADRFHVVGVNVHRRGMEVAVCDFGGRLVELHQQAFRREDGILSQLTTLLRRALAADNGSRSYHLVGMGVGIPGPIDVAAGTVLNPPNFPDIRHAAVRELLGREWNVPVFVDDDARARAVAEHMLGAGRGVSNMVYVSVGTGIGAGIIIDGQLFYGVHGIAGQIGHITVDPGGPICSCGNQGCLESVVEPLLAEPRPDWDRIGFWLGQALVSLGHVVDPELVVMGGDAVDHPAELVGIIQRYLEAHAPFRKVSVRPGELGPRTAVLGASMIAVRELLKNPSSLNAGNVSEE